MRAVDETTNLLLPYILAAQAQKHVTHNEALRKLDALVQISVADRDLAAPPASPLDGQRYIVAASASGAWSGHVGKIAAWQDGAWAIYAPREGFIAWVEDEDVAVAWSGSSWVPIGGGSLNPAPLVGVNATADTTNRLAVSSPATLFNHAGGGHQFKINKNAAGDTASVLFQTGFSGRAEMGLAGGDDYSFKVSPDGSAWFDAIVIDRTTGEVSFPNTSIGGGVTNGDKGDVVVSGGGATWTIDSNVVTNAKLADMATQTFKGRVSAGSGDPEDLTAAQLRTAIALPTSTTAGRLARYTDTAGAQAQTAGIFEDASGNVGIGTTNPTAAALVVTRGTTLPAAQFRANATTPQNYVLNLVRYWDFVEGGSIGHNYTGHSVLRIDQDPGMNFAFQPDAIAVFKGTNKVASIRHDGMLTVPLITGLTSFLMEQGNADTHGHSIYIGNPSSTNLLGVRRQNWVTTLGGNQFQLRHGSASSGDFGTFRFFHGGTTTGNWAFETGNVGIGATDPVCRLDVAGGPIRKRTSYTVATLPAASLGDGMETYVTDSNATLASGHGNVVAGGGSNYVPVYSRGGSWRIG